MRRTNKATSQSPRFSPLADADAPELESMVMALYREDPTGQKMSFRKIRQTVAQLTAHPDKGRITIVRVGDTVVGYVIVIYFWSNEYGGDVAHIDELYVRPPWRSKGIGARCLDHVAGMKGKKLRGVRLEVTPANQKAFAFYSRHGFKLAKNRHMFRELP
jgi:ribosomal protein S18 acetylase RimI-like enzyme